MPAIALILAILFFIAGLLGTILPVLPGAILIFGGMLLYGIMTGFATLNATFFLLQAFTLIILFLIDFLASATGTKRYDGSTQAVWGAVIGTLLGLIFLGPLGIITGPFLGAVIVELVRGKKIDAAIRVGFGTLIGLLGGTLLKLGVEIVMIIYFFIQIY